MCLPYSKKLELIVDQVVLNLIHTQYIPKYNLNEKFTNLNHELVIPLSIKILH